MNDIVHFISACIEKILQTALVPYTVRFYQLLISDDHVHARPFASIYISLIYDLAMPE